MVACLQGPHQEGVQGDRIGPSSAFVRAHLDAFARRLVRNSTQARPTLLANWQHPLGQALDQFVQFRTRLGQDDAHPAQRFPTPLPARMRLQGVTFLYYYAIIWHYKLKSELRKNSQERLF